MPENISEDPNMIERKFWRDLQPYKEPAVYGADLEGSLFDPHIENWNVSKLDTWFHRTLASRGINSIPGVTTPYLYFGSWLVVVEFGLCIAFLPPSPSLLRYRPVVRNNNI